MEKIQEILQDPNLAIMADKCKCIICLLDIFQSRRPVTTKIFNDLEDLQVVIAANKELQYEVCAEYFEKFDLPHPTKTEILRTVLKKSSPSTCQMDSQP